MNRSIILQATIVTTLAFMGHPAAHAAAPAAAGGTTAKSLFNGKDLQGWHVDVPALDKNPAAKGPFIVRDGLLVSLGTPGGHLITDAQYQNYRLEVQYRFAAKPGNCGILVHASTPRALYKMFPKSIEVQMNSGHAGDFWCIVEDITVPDMVKRRGPKEKWGITEGKARRILNLTDDSEKPVGQWNTMVIECRDNAIRVWVNGDLVNDGTDCTANKGNIAVQAEGCEVEFRKMMVTPLKKQAATAAAIEQWRQQRFGMFIHWGPVSLKGTEIGWSRGREVPTAEYDELYKEFNPTKFDADRWVRTAKQAGMKYLVITSKHHDGFCLWPSAYTEYHIGNTPFQRDVLKELATACKENGIELSTYYSICDWRHPDYPLGSPGGKSQKKHPNMPRYFEYVRNQTKEILDNYGPLGIMWFDGEWEKPWTRQYGNQLYDDLKKIQPTLVINNRVSKGRHGMAGTTKQSDLNAGDYDTPEQRVGGFNRQRPWETCMTICRQWAWKPNDQLKSKKQCLQTLLQTVGGDGNLLLNVGPMPDGRIEPRQVERLKEMGAWLQQYGAGVYGTRGGPLKPGKWGASTCKDNTIYLFVMNWPAAGPLELPSIGAPLTRTEGLSCKDVKVEQVAQGVRITVPPEQRDPIVTVIKLTVAGKAFAIDPVGVDSFETAQEKEH